MTTAQCTCGFTEAGDETLSDHLLEVFTPADSRAADGVVHQEWTVALTCACGVATTAPAELDRHFRAVFTPDDAIGPDGEKHEPVSAAGQKGAG
jgi:hypothetical protein